MPKLAVDGETCSRPGLRVKTSVEAFLPTKPPPLGYLGPRGGASPPAGLGHSIRCYNLQPGWLRPCQGDVRKRTVRDDPAPDLDRALKVAGNLYILMTRLDGSRCTLGLDP